MGAALIQRKKDVEEASNLAFTLNLCLGIVFTTITFFAAPYAATFFREPLVAPILRVLGFIFIINALGSTHNIRIQRELNFRRKLAPDIGNSIVKAFTAIGFALAGFGPWSLIFGQLAGAGTSSILLWVVSPWRPKPLWNFGIAREMIKYGFSVMSNNAISIFEDSFDYILIGRFYNTTALGIYSLAFRLPEMLVINILWVMTAVLFPTFSSLQEQKDSLKRSFLSTVRYVELLVMPISLGMIITADPLIRVAFGEQWLDSIPIMQVLSIYALMYSVGFHAGDVYKAIGRPDILLKITIPVFLLRIVGLWIGAQYSLLGVAIGHLLAGILGIIIQLVVASHIMNITIRNFIEALTPALLGGIILSALAIPTLLLTENLMPIFRLAAVTAAGASGYIGFLWFGEKDLLVRAFRMVGFSRRENNQKGDGVL
jgi:PST family polysaccharide transporter